MADTPVEQRVGQVKKYVKKNRGWRPRRRTVIYLVVVVVAMALAAVFVPRVLPGTINDSESLLGRGAAIEVVPLFGGAYHRYVPGPPAGEGYSSWSISQSREEIVVGWYHEAGGKVDKVSVQSRSSYSGRLQVEWPFEPRGGNPRVEQVGFLPQHNQIWFLSSGRLSMIDIKSGAILDYPFKGPGGNGSITPPKAITYAGFSPKSGELAYTEGGKLTLVTGLGTGRDNKPLKAETVLLPGSTKDTAGRVIDGRIESFAWVRDGLLAIIVARGFGVSRPTSLYYADVAGAEPVVRLKIPAPSDGRFVSITRSPGAPQFAVLFASGLRSSSSSPTEYSVRVYDVSGKLKNQFRLPAGPWRPPLSWASP
jgi:hypothetical protein